MSVFWKKEEEEDEGEVGSRKIVNTSPSSLLLGSIPAEQRHQRCSLLLLRRRRHSVSLLLLIYPPLPSFFSPTSSSIHPIRSISLLLHSPSSPNPSSCLGHSKTSTPTTRSHTSLSALILFASTVSGVTRQTSLKGIGFERLGWRERREWPRTRAPALGENRAIEKESDKKR